MGKIKVKELNYGNLKIPVWLKVILSTFLVFPMYLWIRFDDSENCSNSKRQKEKVDTSYYSISIEDLCFEKKKQRVSFIDEMFYLYNAPISKFWISQVFYLIYLFLFSFALLWPACGNIHLDLIVCTWTGVIILDYIYHVVTFKKCYPSISQRWKIIEILTMTLFLFCYIFSRILFQHSFITPYGVKTMLSIALLYFYYRIIFKYFPISSDLGPMLHRIEKMILGNFIGFMKVTTLIMLGNGIVIHAIIYPDYPFSYELLRRIILFSFSTLFKTPANHLNEINNKCIMLKRAANGLTFYGMPDDICKVGRYYRVDCPNTGVWPYIFGLQYFILLKLILLTILLALFSNTQTKLYAEGTYIWKYQRHHLVTEFSNRVVLPAPFSPICYCVKLLKCICNKLIKKKTELKSEDISRESDSTYWKELAIEFSSKNVKKSKEENTAKNRMEKLIALKEAINKQRSEMEKWQGQITELQIRNKRTNKILQSSQLQISLNDRLRIKDVSQLNSRISPYRNTNIIRFPVSNKHLPWSNDWKTYDPIAYTLTKDDFPPNLRSYVDVDIQRIKEMEGENFKMPLFLWNESSVSPAGINLNRKSWILDKSGQAATYKLDSENLPKNPLGRTGLKGRGCLPRWGPNHFIFAIITRWQVLEFVPNHQYLEVIVMVTDDEISLPGGFITTDNVYSTLGAFFKTEKQWLSNTDMISFFESMVAYVSYSDINMLATTSMSQSQKEQDNEPFIFEKVQKGYLDEATNTDQAWCEAEVWHFHYNVPSGVENYFKVDMLWTLMNEKLLEKVPPAQACLLYYTAKKIKASLEVM